MAKRKGQQTFRNRLLRGAKHCEATSSELLFAIDACHIKPYNICNITEKNDPNNALFLLSSIHRAFDFGYISFEDDGRILISSKLSEWELKCLGLTGQERIIMPGNRPKYMEFHRKNIFKK